MRQVALVLLCCFTFKWCAAQIAAGPMLGPVELRDASIWLGLENPSDKANLVLTAPISVKGKIIPGTVETHFGFTTCQFTIGWLAPATTYTYEIIATGTPKKVQRMQGTFTTKTLFQWRHPAPDFTFLTGSCNYVNEAGYDRPGSPYGKDSSIFVPMANEKAALMLWLGDNWYTRETDFYSKWGLWYRAWHDRSIPVLQPFLKSTSHLAIWDDHDYGPNDYGKSYILKNTSRDVFNQFWLNPSAGDGKEGIYTHYQYNDVDFFMLDDRWWRDLDKLPDSVQGLPNPTKKMFGDQQIAWLQDALRSSMSNPSINFRVIATGTQVFNQISPYDRFSAYPFEYQALINFLKAEKIEGVVFLTGDRHSSEVLKMNVAGLYPMFEITCSPLTSAAHTFVGKEVNLPQRMLGVDKVQNYGKITISGQPRNRKMTIQFIGTKGNLLGEYAIDQSLLKFPLAQ